MCGIIGYVGKRNDVASILLEGLKTLEYRGYDSSGIVLAGPSGLEMMKSAGKIAVLEQKVNQFSKMRDAVMGLGHTRWATHGAPTDINAHPHRVGSITIVHNGIVENYRELKQVLQEEGYLFSSDTDTEVVAALLDSLYQKKKDIKTVLQEFPQLVKGSYALGVIVEDDLDHLYAVRADSPLIIGIGEEENLLASDIPAIIPYTKKYLLLEKGEIAVLSKEEVVIYSDVLEPLTKDILEVDWDSTQAEKNGYPHFMIKEIMEEPDVLRTTIQPYLNTIDFDQFFKSPINTYEQIHIVACGSAMHAGLIGKNLLEKYANIPVTVQVASEYRYENTFYDRKTLVIIVSQSGETADTIAAMRKAKQEGIDTLAIVNVVGSTIAREADNVLYIYAGPEIAVATTKAYLLQVTLLSFVAFHFAKEKGLLSQAEIDCIQKDYERLPDLLEKSLQKQDSLQKMASMLFSKNDAFFIGRGVDYALGMEGSLKLKEVSYIHSEAYQAGELKHGTISLIEENTPVYALVTEEFTADKMISNMKEVKARGAYVVLLTTEKLNQDYDCYDELIVVPSVHPFLQSLLVITPLQLLAYYIANYRGCDIDKPRNLAKSVTVE